MVTYSFVHPAVERRGIDEMEQWRSRQQMLLSSMDPALGSRIVEMSQVWPDLPHGALVGLAMVGADPYDDAMAGIDALAAQRSQGLGFRSPGDVVNARQVEREMAAEESQEGFLFRNAKAVVRGAFMGMETAFEEVSRRATAGLVALQDPNLTYGRAMELATPSQGALLASEEFGWADLGEGWIPGGDIREEQERLKQRLTLDGEWMSPGRAIARTVTEPGTRSFDFASGLVDFGFRIFGDPSTYATAGLSKARLASRSFVADNMLIRGVRRTTDEQFARNWWQGSGVGQRLRQSLVDLDDPYEVWLRLGGPQGKVDRETARLIADARTGTALDDIVLPRLGPGGIAEKPVGSPLSRGVAQVFGDDVGAVHGLGIHVRRAADRSRMLQWLPDATLTPNDPDRAMVTLDRFLKGAKFSREERGELMGRAFRIGAGDARDEFTTGWMNLAMDVAEQTAARAIRQSVSDTERGARRAQQIANRIRVSLRDSHDELTNYFVRESTRPRAGTRTMVGGEAIDYEKLPHLATEYLGRNIPLPDMQYVRRHVGSYARAMRTLEDIWQPLGMTRDVFEGTVDLASKLMTRMWKPAVLLRGAYVVRVGGEEQIRMAAAGMSSMIRHPVDYLLYASGRRGHVFNGTSLEDMAEWQAILQRSGGGWLGRRAGSTPTDDWIRFQRGAPGMTDDTFARAYADDLSFLINDETASRVARDGVDATFEYLQTAKGKDIVRAIAQADHNAAVATDPGALRAYLRSVYERIEEKARGNPDIMNAISTGRLDGRVVRGPAADRDGFIKSLRTRLDDIGITEVKGQRIIDPRGRDEITAKLNGVVDILGEWVMSKPTNFGSRSPAWKQSFWRSMERQIGFMDDATQRAVLAQAKQAGLSRATIRRMESARKAGAGGRITSLEDAELIAKGQATTDTRRLLYELTEHGQFSDMMRAAIPFAEAWKEIFVAWARILRDNPQVMRRGQQAVEGARGAGWFWTDPTSGEEMFSYPGGNLVSRGLMSGHFDSGIGQAIGGLPGVGPLVMGAVGAFQDEQPAEFDLVGSVSGLNLFTGSVVPGFGPAVTMPAAVLMPDRPTFDWVRDNVLFPYGEPDVKQGALESALPAWMQRYRTALMSDPETDRTYANSVFDVARALMATGEFSTSSREEIDRLMTVAKQRAKGLFLVRGASQFVAPTGPQARFRVQDLDGDWWPYQVIIQEFGRMRQEHGEEQAVAEFLDSFGTDLITMVQSKSREVMPRPTSQVGDDWIRANDDLRRRYPLTVGLVAPDDPSGEFSYEAYRRSFDEGAREQLTPEQMVWLSNNLLGRFAYSHGVSLIGDGQDTETRLSRAALRSKLMERFPGYNSHLGVRERPSVDDQVAELEAMVADDRVADLEVTGAVREYLDERRRANILMQTMAPRSTTFTRSQETAWIRQMLRMRAQEIMRRTPEFTVVFERVFERELADDEQVLPGEMGSLATFGLGG